MTDPFDEPPFQLSDLSEKEQAFIIRMPYRAGMFVSLCDSTGGGQADEEEMKALEIIVTSYAQDYCKSEFVQQLMNKTVSMKGSWPGWLSNISNVPAECAKMVGMLESRLTQKDLEALKSNVYEIALSVALAYREIDAPPSGLHLIQKKLAFLSYQKSVKKLGQEPLRWEDYLNVSGAEQKALAQLGQSLLLGK